MTSKNWFRTYQDILAESDKIDECECEDKMNEEIVEEDDMSDIPDDTDSAEIDEAFDDVTGEHSEPVAHTDHLAQYRGMGYSDLMDHGWKDIGLHFSNEHDANLDSISHHTGIPVDDMMAVEVDGNWRVMESPSELDEFADPNAKPALDVNTTYQVSGNSHDSDLKGKHVIFLGFETDDNGSNRARVALVNVDGSHGGQWLVKPELLMPVPNV